MKMNEYGSWVESQEDIVSEGSALMLNEDGSWAESEEDIMSKESTFSSSSDLSLLQYIQPKIIVEDNELLNEILN